MSTAELTPEEIAALKQGATRTMQVWHARWEEKEVQFRTLSWVYKLPGEDRPAPTFPDDYRLVATVVVEGPALGVSLKQAVENAYRLTNNIDDTPGGWPANPQVTETHSAPELLRSSSAGDVIVCGDDRFRCQNAGWEKF